MIGQTLSHYRILEQLGRGGMGVVYRSRDERLERDVAIKLLPEGALADPEARQRFRREALALSRLNHPAIATVHDFDSQDGIDFLVMEYVDGETLASRIAAGPLAPDEVAAFGARIAEALEAAHEQGVIHRDLKPGNIMITRRGDVKVLDFGLASLLQTAERPGGGWVTTQTDVKLGTLPYMAPEQLLGKNTDARTDLHALGVVLFEMATGTLPFKNPVSTALVYEIINNAPPRPTTLRPELPEQLEESILRCLGKSPGDRYASARELARELGGAAVREGRVPRGGERGRLTATLIAAGAARLVGPKSSQPTLPDVLEPKGGGAPATAEETQLERPPEERARLGPRRAV